MSFGSPYETVELLNQIYGAARQGKTVTVSHQTIASQGVICFVILGMELPKGPVLISVPRSVRCFARQGILASINTGQGARLEMIVSPITS